MAKKIFQIIDHCSIFLLIAGCATPFALCIFMKEGLGIGWGIFALICLVALIGIILNSIDLKKYNGFSMFCYLAMGWCFLIRADLLLKYLGVDGLVLLILGGIAYTIGAILYCLGKRKRGCTLYFIYFVLLEVYYMYYVY